MAVGGDIIEITYNHPTLGSGVIFPKAAEDSTFNPGGFRSTDDNNMVDGAGNMIDQMNRSRWSFEGTIAWDMNVAEDLEKIVAQAIPILSIDQVIIDRVKATSPENLEDAIQGIVKSELQAIVNLGGILGFVIGILQALILLWK